jgi:antitoxin component YwqK of YwqJK toxin-antitoxin module
MYKLIGLTLGTVFLTTLLYGQEISNEEILKFKIKSITTIDSDGKIKSINFYNDRGDIVKVEDNNQGRTETRKEFIYDSSGNLMEEKTFSSERKIHHVEKYSYSLKNLLVRKEYIDSDGSIDATWTYEYDESGNKVMETQKSGTMSNSVTKFKYLDGRLIETETTNDSIGKENKITYKYNDKGQVVEEKTKVYFSNTTITLTYIYNETGKLTELKEKSSNGVSSLTTYQYDNNGLLMSDIWKSSLGKEAHKSMYKVAF